jgi:hypothetical protein
MGLFKLANKISGGIKNARLGLKRKVEGANRLGRKLHDTAKRGLEKAEGFADKAQKSVHEIHGEAKALHEDAKGVYGKARGDAKALHEDAKGLYGRARGLAQRGSSMLSRPQM